MCSSHQPIGPQPYPVIYAIVWLPIRYYVVCWTGKGQRSEEHHLQQSSNESMKTKQKQKTRQKRQKERNKIFLETQSIRQKKIGEGHSTEKVWSSASREPSDTLPGSQPCTQTHSIYNSVTLRVSGFSICTVDVRESVGWSNQRGSKTSQACYSHPRRNLNLVRLSSASLFLCRCSDV